MTRLPESLRRWIEFPLWFLLISACLAPLPQFIHRLRTNTLPSNAGLLEVVFGLLGFILLWRVTRRLILCLRAGQSVVEIGPAKLGGPLEYRLRVGRPATATLYCRQVQHRRATLIRAEFPLAPAVYDDALGRWVIQGTLTLPEGPATGSEGRAAIRWQIDVKMTFANGAVLEEDHPLCVT